VHGRDAIIHAAAQVSVQASVQDPVNDARQNVLGTVALLTAAARAGVESFVHISSAAVYGMPVRLPIDESHPTRPLSPYGASKLASEAYARMPVKGTHTLIVRPFNVYSSRQDPTNPYSGVLSKFAARIKAGEPPVVFGDGSQTRDFVHATDVAAWLVRATESLPFDSGTCVNLGTGRETAIKALANTFLTAAGMERAPLTAPPLQGEIPQSVADCSLARKAGFRPTVGVEEGVRELLTESCKA
jgi:UDP-glucose 4-epimerase